MRFHGTYQHTVDAKGRVSMPAKFRKKLPDDLVIVPAFDNALYIFAEDQFDAWVDSFYSKYGREGFNERNSDDRRLCARLSGDAEDVTVDSVGRITISQKLRQRCNIDKNVSIVGLRDHIAIWDSAEYEQYMSEISLDNYQEDSAAL